MTLWFDPTQADWNNPCVEYLVKNFEKVITDRRDKIMSLTKPNNQIFSSLAHV